VGAVSQQSSFAREIDPERERLFGAAYGAGAYLLWGMLPIYFVLLMPTGPWEVVAWRILFSLVFCAILLTVVRGGWARVIGVLRNRAVVGWTVVAGLLIYVNWQAFLIATQTGHVIESSLGYFINPIATVLLAVLVLKERVRPLQWAAIGIAAIAVVVIIVAYGAVPWIALTLAASFGIYGLVKKQIGGAVDAVSGLTLETLWLVPIAVAQLIVVAATSGITLGQHGAAHTLLLAASGVATAVPLLLFAAGARRVTLTTIGLLQFIAPILQFLTGVLLLGEPMPAERWAGFVIVWIACAVLVADMLREGRRSRRAAARQVPLAT